MVAVLLALMGQCASVALDLRCKMTFAYLLLGTILVQISSVLVLEFVLSRIITPLSAIAVLGITLMGPNV
jgi:hypothetical protein